MWRVWDAVPARRVVVPPSPLLRTRARRRTAAFLDSFRAGAVIVEIGSKSRRLAGHVINLDLMQRPEVDVLGDGHCLPFLPDSLDGVIICNVLEIVPNPRRVVAEIHRALRPGGRIYAEMPFIQPYHPDPLDTHRFTEQGVRRLFDAFQEQELGVAAGPGSAMAWLLREYVGAWSSNFFIHHVLRLLAGWLFFPLRYTDYVLNDQRFAGDLASSFYYIGEKS